MGKRPKKVTLKKPHGSGPNWAPNLQSSCVLGAAREEYTPGRSFTSSTLKFLLMSHRRPFTSTSHFFHDASSNWRHKVTLCMCVRAGEQLWVSIGCECLLTVMEWEERKDIPVEKEPVTFTEARKKEHSVFCLEETVQPIGHITLCWGLGDTTEGLADDAAIKGGLGVRGCAYHSLFISNWKVIKHHKQVILWACNEVVI